MTPASLGEIGAGVRRKLGVFAHDEKFIVWASNWRRGILRQPTPTESLTVREYGGWVYMLASKRNGTLYTGVTNNIIGRAADHKAGVASKFTRQYGVRLLVWYEGHDRIKNAIQRETSIKRWPRQWKLDLIEKNNPNWEDLFERLTRAPELPAWAR